MAIFWRYDPGGFHDKMFADSGEVHHANREMERLFPLDPVNE
jgi:hypothetical protein